MAQYNYILSDFPNNKYDSDTLGEEIVDSSISSSTLDRIDGNATGCSIFFLADLSSPDVSTLDTVVATHTGIPAVDPVIVQDLTIDGSLLGDTGVFTGDYRIEGKLWVETIRRVKQEATDMWLRIGQDTPLSGSNTSGIEIFNVATVGDSFIFGVNKEGILMAGWNDPSTGPNLSPVGGGVYGTEFHLNESNGSTTSSATTPQTKVTMVTSNLPAGKYKIFAKWRFSHSSDRSSALFDITVNGSTLGTQTPLSVEPKDTTNITSLTESLYLDISGVNTILLRFWNENDSTTISDASIELIRVS